MNHSFLIIVSLFLTLINKISCQNTTAASNPETPTTTAFFTSAFATLADVTVSDADDPTDDANECLFETVETLQDSEEIEITICGYLASDDVKTPMVGIQLQVPQDRWVGVGFVLNANFNSEDAMKDAYSVIVSPYSRNIQERRLASSVAPGDPGVALQSQITLFEDIFDNGLRIMKLKRKLTIPIADLENANVDTLLHYFDFSKFQACQEKITVIWAFGKLPNQVFSYHGVGNRGYMEASIEAIKGVQCAGGSTTDKANQLNANIINTIIISMIAMVANIIY